MEINIFHLTEGAEKARGIAIVIDVFRAFSLVCYLIDQGAERIIPVADISTAYAWKKKHPRFVLIGERHNRKMPGFDYGNSPEEVRGVDFSNKTIIHTTSSGTQGITRAKLAEEVLTGSFVNAGALIRYVKTKDPDKVSLVCMGYAAAHPIEEDSLCAEYIKQKLEGGDPDFSGMVETIRKTSGQRFFNPRTQAFCPSADFYNCLRLDAFDFTVKAFRDEEFGIVLKRI